MDAPAPDRLPRDAGSFRILKELGRGGMGVVYEAEEVGSGRHVALKILPARLHASEEAFERFRREARLAASISDPRCVYVYGAHEIEGSPAISMELVTGETLEDRLSTGEPIPVETALSWTLDVLEGLEAARRAGVVHRDVKPSNCFLTSDGRVKVGDFGLSRTLDPGLQLTQAGTFLGSPLYASPEQVRGDEVDFRSDLYSAAATLHALLAGKPPFGGTTFGEVLSKILTQQPPPIRSVRPDVPRGLERVLLRALAKDPAHRPASHAAFRESLLPYCASRRTAASPGARLLAYLADAMLLGLVNTGATLALVSTGASFAETIPAAPTLLRSAALQILFSCLAPILYFALAEGLTGRSLGKMLVGLRVVPIEPGRPTLRPATIRIAVLSLLTNVPITWFSHAIMTESPEKGGLVTFAALLQIVVIGSTMRRRNGWRGPHEFASGTRTVSDRASIFLRTEKETFLAPERPLHAESPSRVGVHAIEGTVGATPRGPLLLGRDSALDRPVWVVPAVAGAGDDAAGGAAETGLRWLERTRSEDGTNWNVFEACGGASLPEYLLAGRRLPPSHALRAIASLAGALVGDASPRSLAHVWIDSRGSVRCLPFPVGDHETEPRSRLELLAAAARALLFGSLVDVGPLPAALPSRAEPVLQRLLGGGAPFRDGDEAARALVQAAEGALTIGRGHRIAQILLASLFPTASAFFLAAGTGVLIAPIETIILLQTQKAEDARAAGGATEEPRVDSPDTRVGGLRVGVQVSSSGSGDVEQPPEPAPVREARLVLVSRGVSHWTWQTQAPAVREKYRVLTEEALAAHPAPTDAEVAAAKALLAAQGSRGRGARSIPVGMMTWGGIGGIYLVFGFAALLSALLFRGALSFLLLGIAVRSANGGRASRLRCMLRALVVWSPPVLASFGAAVLAGFEFDGSAHALGAAGLLVLLGGAVLSARTPERGPQDRIAGTVLVPR